MPYARAAHTDVEVHVWVRDMLIASGGVTTAHRDETLAGVLTSARGGAASWITQLYVDPEFVGQGIGTRVVAQARATLPSAVRLYAFRQNVHSRRFYERHGFRAIKFTDSSAKEGCCPDVLHELAAQ